MLAQEPLNDFIHVFVSPDAPVAVPNDPVAIDDELRRPKIAQIIPPHFLLVINDDREFDIHLHDGVSKAFDASFIVGAGSMDPNDDESVLSILAIEIDDMRHCLNTWLALERPE